MRLFLISIVLVAIVIALLYGCGFSIRRADEHPMALLDWTILTIFALLGCAALALIVHGLRGSE